MVIPQTGRSVTLPTADVQLYTWICQMCQLFSCSPLLNHRSSQIQSSGIPSEELDMFRSVSLILSDMFLDVDFAVYFVAEVTLSVAMNQLEETSSFFWGHQ